MLKNYSLNRMLVLFSTIGFVLLLIDTTIEHWDDFNKNIFIFTPTVYCIVAIILGTLTVIKWKENLIHSFQIVLFIALVVSAAGLYFHLAEDDDEEKAEIKTEQMNKEEDDKPILAPLAFGELAVFGLLGTSKKWKAE